jgi:transcriptional regulator with XRE-family HTH domain
MKKGIISKNIGLLMEHFGIKNESQLAKLVGSPQTTINKLTSGVSVDPRISTLAPITEYFNISIDTLLQDNPNFEEIAQKFHNETNIPIIHLNELNEMFGDIVTLDHTNWPHWYPIRYNPDINYAIQIKYNQLSQPFNDSCLLIVDENCKLKNNYYFIFKHLSSNTISIKKIHFENGEQWLLALQNDLPPTKFNESEWQSLGMIKAKIVDMHDGSFINAGG